MDMNRPLEEAETSRLPDEQRNAMIMAAMNFGDRSLDSARKRMFCPNILR